MSEMAAIASINKKFFNSILFKNLGQFTDFFDVEIWIEGSKLLAHRLVLAHGSSVFHKMLKDVDHTKRPPIRKTILFHFLFFCSIFLTKTDSFHSCI